MVKCVICGRNADAVLRDVEEVTGCTLTPPHCPPLCRSMGHNLCVICVREAVKTFAQSTRYLTPNGDDLA